MPGAPRTNRADVAAVMLSQLNREESYQQKITYVFKAGKIDAENIYHCYLVIRVW